MIVFILYLVAIWGLAHWFRRRWQGYAIALLSVFPVAAAALMLPGLLNIGVSMASPALAALPAAYAVLVCAGALLIAAQPRRPAVGCGSCGYDLAGNTSGVCPECGVVVRPGATRPTPTQDQATPPAAATTDRAA